MAKTSKTPPPPIPIPAGVGGKDAARAKDVSLQQAGGACVDPTDPEAMDAWLKQNRQVLRCMK